MCDLKTHLAMSATGKSAPRRKVATTGGSARSGKNRSSAAPVGGSSRAGAKVSVAAVAAHLGSGELVRSSGSERPVLESGTEWIADIVITPSTVNDSVVYNWWISPTNVTGRISAIARQWERWMPRRLIFRYVPIVPATTGGQCMLWIDPDVDDESPSAPVTGSVFASDTFVAGPVWSSMDAQVRHLDKQTLLFTRDRGAGEADDRLEYAGQLYVGYVGPAVASNTVLGRIVMDYEIEFSKRCWEDVPYTATPTDVPMTTTSFSTNDLISVMQTAQRIASEAGIKITSKGIEIAPHTTAFIEMIANLQPKMTGAAAAGGLLETVIKRGSDLLEAFPGMMKVPGDYPIVTVAGTQTHAQLSRNAVGYIAPGVMETVVNFAHVANDTGYPVYLDWRMSWAPSATADKPAVETVTGLFIGWLDIHRVPVAYLYDHALDADTTSHFVSDLTWQSPSGLTQDGEDWVLPSTSVAVPPVPMGVSPSHPAVPSLLTKGSPAPLARR